MKLLTRKDIRRVVVVLAGSRTGSSFLFRALNLAGRFLAPTGEETPYYRKAGVGVFRGPEYSDAILQSPPETTLDAMGQALLSDVGERIPGGACPAGGVEILAEDFLNRVDLQWPGCIPASKREEIAEELIEKLSVTGKATVDWTGFYDSWLRRLKRSGIAVEPGLLTSSGPHPTRLPLLEEPPYVAPAPRLPSASGELPLLLKTTTNAYRIPLLRALFPNAAFRWIVLRRNPAASVSALMDGWLSSAFHSHDVGGGLDIKGYSDEIPGGRRYWKFDLPPGWQAFGRSPLEEVCAFQWLSAYRAIEKSTALMSEPVHRVSYEELVAGRNCERLLAQLVAFSGTEARTVDQVSLAEAVMAVNPPRPGKWRKRASRLVPMLEDFEGGELLDLARSMGYEGEPGRSWP